MKLYVCTETEYMTFSRQFRNPGLDAISILLWNVCFTLSPNRLCFSSNFLCHSSDPREALCANAHSTPTKPSWSSLSGKGELRIKTFKISYGTPWEAKARALSTTQAASPSLETGPGLSPDTLMHTNENTPLSRRNKHIYTHAFLNYQNCGSCQTENMFTLAVCNRETF